MTLLSYSLESIETGKFLINRGSRKQNFICYPAMVGRLLKDFCSFFSISCESILKKFSKNIPASNSRRNTFFVMLKDILAKIQYL